MSAVSPVKSKVTDVPLVILLVIWSSPSGWALYLRATVCSVEPGLAMVTVTLAVVRPVSPNSTPVMFPLGAAGRL